MQLVWFIVIVADIFSTSFNMFKKCFVDNTRKWTGFDQAQPKMLDQAVHKVIRKQFIWSLAGKEIMLS